MGEGNLKPLGERVGADPPDAVDELRDRVGLDWDAGRASWAEASPPPPRPDRDSRCWCETETMPAARIGIALERSIAMPIGRGKTGGIGIAVEHDTALPLLSVGGAGAVPPATCRHLPPPL